MCTKVEERVARGLVYALLTACVLALLGAWYINHESTKAYDARFSSDNVLNDLMTRNLTLASYRLPVSSGDDFKLTVLERSYSSASQITIYAHIEFRWHNDTLIEGLAAIRYERVNNEWYPVRVDDVNLTLDSPLTRGWRKAK